jgi:hypothetical protein
VVLDVLVWFTEMEEELSVSCVNPVDAVEVKSTPNPKILKPLESDAVRLTSFVNELLTERLVPSMVLLL